MPSSLRCTPVIHVIQRHSPVCIHNHFLLGLLTLMSLKYSSLCCQSRLLLCSQGSSPPPPWPPLCWSLIRGRWWLDRLVGVWSRLGSPRYASKAITLSAIKRNCQQTNAPHCCHSKFSLHKCLHRVHNPFRNHHFPIWQIATYCSLSLPGTHEPPLVWKEP